MADRNNDIQVVVQSVVGFAVWSSYPEIPDNCLLRQFAFLEYVADVLVDGSHILVEQVGHLALRQPDGFPLQPDADILVVNTVNQQFFAETRLSQQQGDNIVAKIFQPSAYMALHGFGKPRHGAGLFYVWTTKWPTLETETPDAGIGRLEVVPKGGIIVVCPR